MGEISRVLQSNGIYITISHGQPSYRLTYLQRPEFGWNVKIYTVQKPMMGMTASLSTDDKDNVHYVYVCVKGETAGTMHNGRLPSRMNSIGGMLSVRSGILQMHGVL